MPWWKSGHWGNEFLSGCGICTLNHSIDTMTKKGAYRFTARNSKTVNKIRVYFYDVIGSPTLKVGLQSDDGSPNHYPSGTWLTSANISPTTNHWQDVVVAGYAIVKGTIYHVVIEPVTVDASNRITYRSTNYYNTGVLEAVGENPNRATLYYDGTSWSIYIVGYLHEPVYILYFTDGTGEGNSYEGHTWMSIYGVYWEKQRFKVEKNYIITDINVPLSCLTTTPEDHLYFDLKEDGVSIASGILINKADASTTWAWHTYTTSLVLRTNKIYDLILKSPTTTSANAWRMDFCEYYINQHEDVGDSVTFPYGLYDGRDAYESSSSDSGASWTDRKCYDIPFYFSVTEVPPLVASASASPTSGDAPLTVSFTGSANGGVPPYSYAWSFGDTGTSSEQNPTHIYESAGTYTALLIVTDDLGKTAQSNTIEITVTAPPTAPAPRVCLILAILTAFGLLPYAHGLLSLLRSFRDKVVPISLTKLYYYVSSILLRPTTLKIVGRKELIWRKI